MKKSIARIISRRITLLMVLAFIILIFASFVTVSTIVRDNSNSHANNIVGIYADLAAFEAEKADAPLDEEFAAKINQYGDYFCKWNHMDYAYMYIPDTTNNTIKYIAISQSDTAPRDMVSNITPGKVAAHKLNEAETAVWNGEALTGHQLLEAFNGNEVQTIYKVTDTKGNSVLAAVMMSYQNIYDQTIRAFSKVALIIILVLAAIYLVIYRIIRNRISRPLKHISSIMSSYIDDREQQMLTIDDKTCDEYSMITDSFNSMTRDINAYLENIEVLNNDKLKQQAEFEVASKIQQNMLPKEKILSEDFYIQAMMKPAKNVGGDLYDYIALDENRTLLTIADVSGKGISAAIFMAIALVLFRDYAKTDKSPAAILEHVNNTLAENNPAMMFATAFVGIYDGKSRSFTYSNAGHNLPYLLSDKLYTLDDAAGTILGVFPGEKYTEKTIQLKPGDTLYMYTDGVNEVINEDKEFYGNERLERLLESYIGKEASNLVNDVYEEIRSYAGSSEQFDDITELSLTCRDSDSMMLDYDISEFEKIKNKILALDLSRSRQLELCLAAEEIFANIISYAFVDGAPQNEKIRFTLSRSDVVVLRFEDGGQPFNPLEKISDLSDYDPDTQIGGLGVSLTREATDEMFYEYTDGKNVLTLIKRYEEEE